MTSFSPKWGTFKRKTPRRGVPKKEGPRQVPCSTPLKRTRLEQYWNYDSFDDCWFAKHCSISVYKMSRPTDFRNFVEALSYSAVQETSKRGPIFYIFLAKGRGAPLPPVSYATARDSKKVSHTCDTAPAWPQLRNHRCCWCVKESYFVRHPFNAKLLRGFEIRVYVGCCWSRSVGAALHARCTTDGMWAKNSAYIYVRVCRKPAAIVSTVCDLYCCSLPQCEASRACRSGLLIATLPQLQTIYSA